MDELAPLGPVYQAGTLSGNPLAMAAGLKAMEILARPGTYERLEQLGAQPRRRPAPPPPPPRASRPCVNRVGSMLTLFFCAAPVTDYATAKPRTHAVRPFFRGMRDRGVFLPPLFSSEAPVKSDSGAFTGFSAWPHPR